VGRVGLGLPCDGVVSGNHEVDLWEDRLFVPFEYVPLYKSHGWKRKE
jgi:hypothetical protein